jgi:hypothetical protein
MKFPDKRMNKWDGLNYQAFLSTSPQPDNLTLTGAQAATQ